MTELALLSIVLIVILLGAVDLARVFQSATALQEAAREGARHAAWYDTSKGTNPYLTDLNSDSNSIQNQIKTVLQGAGLLSGAQTLTTASNCPASSGTPPADTAHINAYVCLDPTAPSDVSCPTTNAGHDVEVAILMKFPLIVQTGIIGVDPNFPVTSDAHLRVQGC